MVDTDRKINLEIKDITVEEARKVMMLVREFDKNESNRFIFTQIKGLEELDSVEAGEILLYIFPHLKSSS